MDVTSNDQTATTDVKKLYLFIKQSINGKLKTTNHDFLNEIVKVEASISTGHPTGKVKISLS